MEIKPGVVYIVNGPLKPILSFLKSENIKPTILYEPHSNQIIELTENNPNETKRAFIIKVESIEKTKKAQGDKSLPLDIYPDNNTYVFVTHFQKEVKVSKYCTLKTAIKQQETEQVTNLDRYFKSLGTNDLLSRIDLDNSDLYLLSSTDLLIALCIKHCCGHILPYLSPLLQDKVKPKELKLTLRLFRCWMWLASSKLADSNTGLLRYKYYSGVITIFIASKQAQKLWLKLQPHWNLKNDY